MSLRHAALAALIADGATVVTPNRRLAREIKRLYDARQAADGRTVWPSADVLPWDAWLVRCYQDIAPASLPPVLLSDPQQQVYWEQVTAEVRSSRPLLQPAMLAALAGEAWSVLNEYGDIAQLARAAGNEDHQAFSGWARDFARRLRTRQSISLAELPVFMAQALGAGTLTPPRQLVCAGFDGVGAAPRRLVEALRAAGCTVVDAPTEPEPPLAEPVRVGCADLSAQWRQVADWACARLQAAPQARIGIVVPDLGTQRDALVHALVDALSPALRVQPDQAAARPFNVSLGQPLAQAPLVSTALTLFDLLCESLPIVRVGSLLRSPFLAGGGPDGAEAARRAKLDRALRADGHWMGDLDRLRRVALRLDASGAAHGDSAPQFGEALSQIERRLAPLRGRRQSVPAWIAVLFDVLSDIGFPGRSLDSVEYQTHLRWRELMASMASLDTLLGAVRLDDVVARLRRSAGDTLFQAETGDVPVQVLGVLEAAHLQFDHLWVANLSDDRWPPEPQPNPLLPLALQRAWQVPSASPDLALALARQRMQDWRANVGELVYSHAEIEGDRPALASPLIAQVRAQRYDTLVAAPSPLPAQRLAGTAVVASIVDQQAPALDAQQAAQMRGGTRLFADQSACAFRAFAVHRLHASALVTPSPGLDAAARGGLLHAALAAFWQGLPSQAALRALGVAALHARVVTCAAEALDALVARQPHLIGRQLRALEQERLLRTIHAWLDVEDTRPPFTVVTVEAEGEMSIGGLHVTVRPDRVDRLADGSLAIIDYKTGRVTAAAWLDERPEEPQLPLYACAYADGAMPGGAQSVSVLAFAQLRPGDTRTIAVAAADGLLPDARVIADDEIVIAHPGWSGLMQDWQASLAHLARRFIDGDAAVAPKHLIKSCRYCDLPLLCRRDERASLAARLAADETSGADDE
jgi:ATP-dependent helicase/nuclease subunit B